MTPTTTGASSLAANERPRRIGWPWLASAALAEFGDGFERFAREMAAHETREERLAQLLAEPTEGA